MKEQELYTDEALLNAMAAGNQHAFTLLYERYWDRLFVKAFKVVGKREEAEDMVQNVFLALWNRREDLKIEGALGAYLDTSIRYMAIRHIERNITQRQYLSLLTELGLKVLPADSELYLHFKEASLIINEVVGNMPPKMQAVYRLSREEYLSHKEIAERLGISPETVKKHIQHALQLIKLALASLIPAFGRMWNNFM